MLWLSCMQDSDRCYRFQTLKSNSRGKHQHLLRGRWKETIFKKPSLTSLTPHWLSLGHMFTPKLDEGTEHSGWITLKWN